MLAKGRVVLKASQGFFKFGKRLLCLLSLIRLITNGDEMAAKNILIKFTPVDCVLFLKENDDGPS